jgi:hypothetical protein
MASDETERFKRLQQERQHGHDVVHHGLAHRALRYSSRIFSENRLPLFRIML